MILCIIINRSRVSSPGDPLFRSLWFSDGHEVPLHHTFEQIRNRFFFSQFSFERSVGNQHSFRRWVLMIVDKPAAFDQYAP